VTTTPDATPSACGHSVGSDADRVAESRSTRAKDAGRPARRATMAGMQREPTPAVVGPWLVELARTLPGLLPGPLPPATRQRVLVAVSDENGSRTWSYVHGAWRDFLGATPHVEAEQAVTDYARACAAAGRPLDTTTLEATLPREAVRALRATVATVELATLATDATGRLVGRLTGRRRLAGPATLVWEAALTALTAPLAATAVAAATTAKLVDRLAARPALDVPPDDEANLLVHVVAASLQAWMANAAVRLAVTRLPFTISIALRDGRAEATVKVGQGRVAIRNGVDAGATVLLDGELGPVLRAASGSFLERLGHIHIRRV
jgi:hypothetical protein